MRRVGMNQLKVTLPTNRYPLQAIKQVFRPSQVAWDTKNVTAFNPHDARASIVSYFWRLHELGDMSGRNSVVRRQVTMSHLGFWLDVKSSTIPSAGRGVFIRGHARQGQPVAMYPGTLYRPGQPAFFVSLNNRYVLRCCDGVLVDGKSSGLSRFVYRSADRRDNYPGITPTADTTWMTSNPKNPLAIGQIVNNGTTSFPPNVRYQELDFTTADCPLELQRYLPNIWYANDWHGEEDAFNSLRTVVLVATRDLIPDEELFSTYIE